MTTRAILAALPLLLLHATLPAQDTTVIHCGRLLAIPGEPPLANQTLVVRDGKIASVIEGLADPRDAAGGAPAKVIDLKDAFVLPGLIDCHTHLTNRYDQGIRLRYVEESDADHAIRGAAYARRTLLAGVTTTRDLGNPGDSAFALRDGIAAGLIPGPRMLVAGRAISATGGHGDPTLGYRDDLSGIRMDYEGIGDGPDALRRAVRAQVRRGADVVKVMATGGVLSNTAAGYEQQLFEDELAAIVMTAHLLGRKVAAHAHGANGIKAALRAGVDSIEHGVFLDDECIELFKRTGAFLVPTLSAADAVAVHAEIPGYYTPAVAAKARIVGPTARLAFTRAHQAGVRIAFGTDAGVGEHGANAHELELMVKFGMPAAEALACATRHAAELCGLASEVGTIAPGKAADVIATRSSPLDDISEMTRVRFVMRAGIVHRNEP